MTKLKQFNAHSDMLVRVSTPARLHLGFLDLNGSTGRKFGSIGLAINSFHTTVEAKRNKTSVQSAETNKKTQAVISQFYASLGQAIPLEQRNIDITLQQLIPQHAGFGSGTQYSLAIGSALCKIHNIQASTREIANQLGRGSRSGIGIATFDHGGFIVDGGLANTTSVPPLLARHPFPSPWRIVLIMDNDNKGVHGSDELKAFSNLATFPLISAQTICHLTLMKLLPALIEQDIDEFGQAISDIQSLIGDHFSSAQGGRYTSPSVEKLLLHSQHLGHKGISQSSWGPTGCVFVDSEKSAQDLIAKLKLSLSDPDDANIVFSSTAASSNGANIEILPL